MTNKTVFNFSMSLNQYSLRLLYVAVGVGISACIGMYHNFFLLVMTISHEFNFYAEAEFEPYGFEILLF